MRECLIYQQDRTLGHTARAATGADKIGHAVEFPLDRIVALRRRGRAQTLDTVTAVDPDLGHTHLRGRHHVVRQRLRDGRSSMPATGSLIRR